MKQRQSTAAGGDRKREKSEQTLAAIVGAAVELAARQGLRNLALGDIARELGISKSGVFVRVGSIEALQLRVVDACEQQFRELVLVPTASEPPGLPQIDAIVRLWIVHGSTLKALLGAHYEAQAGDQATALDRRLQNGLSQWRRRLEGLVVQALSLGHMRSDTDPPQFVFEVFGIMLGYFYDTRVADDPRHRSRAMAAYLRLVSTYRSFSSPGP